MPFQFFLVLLGAWFFLQSDAFAEGTPCSLNTSSLREDARDVNKRAAEEESKNPLLFCRRNAFLEYLKIDDPQHDYSSLKMPELKKKVSEFFSADAKRFNQVQEDLKNAKLVSLQDLVFIRQYEDPWTRSLIPDASNRMMALNEALKQMAPQKKEFSSLFTNPDPMSEEKKNLIAQNIERLRHNSAKNVTSSNSPALRSIACSDLGISDVSSCQKALQMAASEFMPAGSFDGRGTKFTDLDDWSKIMTDSRYDEGLRLQAQQMMDVAFNGKPISSQENIYDDLKTNFEKTHLSPAESAQAASMTLAIIANGAANTFPRLQQLESSDLDDADNLIEGRKKDLSQKSEALSFIAAATPYFDNFTAKNGYLYSLPGNAISACDNSKSYHYWMAYRLAQRLVQEGHFSPTAAAKAAFTIEKAYHIMREEGLPRSHQDESSKNTALESPVYDAPSQTDRTDYAFAVAGAFGGALSNAKTSPKINVDSSLPVMIQEGSVLTPLNHEDTVGMGLIQKGLRINSIFAPNAAFENVKSQVQNSLQSQ